VRSQYTTEDPVLPQGPGGFEFSFESASLSVGDFRRLIVEEAASFRASQQLERRLQAEGGGDVDMAPTSYSYKK
jgi:hypothetical protein